jgi:glycosyltransferase involved in cell wall biosynthesis
MISLIICSRTPALSQKLANNIAETIGVPYEIVLLDNSANTYGICQAYNIGVQQSKYDVLCFMHDDIFTIAKTGD